MVLTSVRHRPPDMLGAALFISNDALLPMDSALVLFPWLAMYTFVAFGMLNVPDGFTDPLKYTALALIVMPPAWKPLLAVQSTNSLSVELIDARLAWVGLQPV